MANFIEPTPIKTLKERKKKIDSYIDRMDKAGCKGDFVDMYKKIQLNFETAINILERAQAKTSNEDSALPISDVSGTLPDFSNDGEVIGTNNILSKIPLPL